MDRYIYLNGQLVPADQATISPFDRGFLFGDGLFETIRCYRGQAHLLGRHLDRLERGAGVLGIAVPARPLLEGAIDSTVLANGGGDCVVRVSLTRGIGEHVMRINPETPPTLLITTKPLLHANDLSKPEAVIVLDVKHVPPAIGVRLKALNYMPAAVAARQLAAAGVREGVLLTAEGLVAAGTVSNLFCVLNGVLLTPPLSMGVLAGITRGRVLELAAAHGVEIGEMAFDLPTLAGAAEFFYTNSVREIVPVVALNAHAIGGGQVGPVTELLRQAYRAEAPLG